jgi:hypothetical protein
MLTKGLLTFFSWTLLEVATAPVGHGENRAASVME